MEVCWQCLRTGREDSSTGSTSPLMVVNGDFGKARLDSAVALEGLPSVRGVGVARPGVQIQNQRQLYEGTGHELQ